MSRGTVKRVIEQHIRSNHTDVSMMADEVRYCIMPSGDTTQGAQAVLKMLNYFFRIAFNARMQITNSIYTAEQAIVEGFFVGKHTGEFAGIPPTGQEVRVPMCVVYELEGEKITKARIYFEIPALMTQLSAAPKAL